MVALQSVLLVVGGELTGGEVEFTQSAVDAAYPYSSGTVFEEAADVLGYQAVGVVVGEQRVVGFVVAVEAFFFGADKEDVVADFADGDDAGEVEGFLFFDLGLNSALSFLRVLFLHLRFLLILYRFFYFKFGLYLSRRVVGDEHKSFRCADGAYYQFAVGAAADVVDGAAVVVVIIRKEAAVV